MLADCIRYDNVITVGKKAGFGSVALDKCYMPSGLIEAPIRVFDKIAVAVKSSDFGVWVPVTYLCRKYARSAAELEQFELAASLIANSPFQAAANWSSKRSSRLSQSNSAD